MSDGCENQRGGASFHAWQIANSGLQYSLLRQSILLFRFYEGGGWCDKSKVIDDGFRYLTNSLRWVHYRFYNAFKKPRQRGRQMVIDPYLFGHDNFMHQFSHRFLSWNGMSATASRTTIWLLVGRAVGPCPKFAGFFQKPLHWQPRWIYPHVPALYVLVALLFVERSVHFGWLVRGPSLFDGFAERNDLAPQLQKRFWHAIQVASLFEIFFVP